MTLELDLDLNVSAIIFYVDNGGILCCVSSLWFPSLKIKPKVLDRELSGKGHWLFFQRIQPYTTFMRLKQTKQKLLSTYIISRW